MDNYCKFLDVHGEDCEKYVMLDVVGDEKQSKANYETMVKRGFKPMFVLTMFDNDLNFFLDTMNVNRHCCVAGGVTTKGDWMTKRFQQAYKASNEKALIHGLGYVTYPKMLQLPLASVDSSSWIVGAQKFGLLSWFDNGIKKVTYKEAIKNVPKGLRKVLNDIEVSVSQFVNYNNFRGNASISTLLSLIAYYKYQRYCYMHGLRLFLATGSVNLPDLLWINENIDNPTYEKFLKYKKKMNRQAYIKVQLKVEGIHRWEKCNIEEVSFLKNAHRHIFHIVCKKKVSHQDREIEIIKFKRQIQSYLVSKYGSPCNFQEMSCEMIAFDILKNFALNSCEVLEDGENGAIIE